MTEQIIYVGKCGNDDNNGLRRNRAKITVNSALAEARKKGFKVIEFVEKGKDK